MNLFDAVENRRSIKHYNPNISMSDSEFNRLISATLLSPTSYNIQHWRFLRITDKQIRKQIKEAAWGQEQIELASELIILCADTQAWQNQPERYWQNADKATQNMLVEMLDNFYRGKPQLQRDEAIRSCGIAAQTLMLAAKSIGYDSCPMIGFDSQAVSDIINLPEGHLIGLIITVGKAEQPARPRGGQLPLSEVLFENKFSPAN